MGNGFTRGWLNKHRVLRNLMAVYVTTLYTDRGYCHRIRFTSCIHYLLSKNLKIYIEL